MPAPFGSISTSIATALFQTRILDPWLDKKIGKRELNKAVQAAVESIWDKFEDCFIRKRGALNEGFWNDKKLIEQLWETLADISKPQIIPDFDVLYKAYCDIWIPEAQTINRLEFDQVIQDFWKHFLEHAVKSNTLDERLRKKQIPLYLNNFISSSLVS